MNENIGYLQAVLQEQWQEFWAMDYGIEREQLPALKKMSSNPYAVVVSGFRRTGKSTLMRQLAQHLGKESFYYVNFEDERFLDFTPKQWNTLYQAMLGAYGERKIFIIDEVQNILGWERFVRRFTDNGFRFYLTGSNAQLLSRELGTKLTGQYLSLEVFPFSFSEFLDFKRIGKVNFEKPTTKERAKMGSYFLSYLFTGGIPNALKYPEAQWHKTLYDNVLYKDVASRYKINETRALQEAAFYLISNTSSSISFNKMKENLKLGSVNTVKNYVHYLEEAWLLFTINVYDFSVKRQQIAAKKVYSIDTGLTRSVAFSFSENRGKLLENLVFLNLRRQSKEIYYYKTKTGKEVDFYLPREKLLIQSTQSMTDSSTSARETASILEAMEETNIKHGIILTEAEETYDNKKIKIMPIWKWLLGKS